MEELFWQIYNCNGERDVDKLVNTNPLLSNPDNWHPYGNNTGNFGTFENQQPHPIPALAEKITNSIDSILTKECLLRGINPKGNDAPSDMAQAVEQFFGIKNGDFSEVAGSDRRNLARNIQVIATGDKQTPDMTVVDDGEGQNPDDFPDTFLSIANNNKVGIPFVQGKYNMGSTGAVTFCGEKRYQLIASKRNANLENATGDLGFTLVRRHPLSDDDNRAYRSTWYEYFYPNNIIPRFNVGKIDVGLEDKLFESGAIVKLYSYDLQGASSNIILDFWRELNQILYLPALPILLYEKREYQSHGYSKPVLGNKNRFAIDDWESKEVPTKTLIIENKEIGKVTVEITIFKQEVKANNNYVREKAVIFTINGQTQGFLHRSFISQSLNLPQLRDYMLIHVDCTNINTSFRQDLFMANRYHMKESDKTEKLKKLIIEKIKEDWTLKALNQARREQLFRNSETNNELLKNLAKKLPISDELKNLLKKNGPLSFMKDMKQKGERPSENQTKEEHIKSFEENRFPSFFKLKENSQGKKVKNIPINGKGIIQFSTDVQNEYFFRPKDKGELIIKVLAHKKYGGEAHVIEEHNNDEKYVQDLFEVTKSSPNNGNIKVSFKPDGSKLNVGDEIELSAILTSPGEDLEVLFDIKVTNPQKEQSKPKLEDYNEPNLPRLVKVYKEDWNNYQWDKHDIVKIFVAGDDSAETMIEDIAINMDSLIKTKYLSKFKSTKDIETKTNKYLSTIYFHSMYLYSVLQKLKQSGQDDMKNIEIDELISTSFKYYAPALVELAEISLYDTSDE